MYSFFLSISILPTGARACTLVCLVRFEVHVLVRRLTPSACSIYYGRPEYFAFLYPLCSESVSPSVAMKCSSPLLFFCLLHSIACVFQSFENVDIYSYSDKITDAVCSSVETALVNGWTFRLVGPGLHFGGAGGVHNKRKALSLIAESLNENSVFIFADAFDVIYQGSNADFRSALDSMQSKLGVNASDGMIFGADLHCWPFRAVNSKFHCELMQGKEYITKYARGASGISWPVPPDEPTPLACRMQSDMVPPVYNRSSYRYLNAGVSLGTAQQYRAFCKAADKFTQKIATSCHGDQSVPAWLMVTKQVSIQLDHSMALFGGANRIKFAFDNSSCKWVNQQNKMIPALLHHHGPKFRFEEHRKQIVRCKFNGDVTLYNQFKKGATFFLDGVQRYLTEICPKLSL